jgi:hypothetical protein
MIYPAAPGKYDVADIEHAQLSVQQAFPWLLEELADAGLQGRVGPLDIVLATPSG